MEMVQQLSRNKKPHKIHFVSFLLLLLAIATLLWILSITNIIAIFWSSIFSIIFTFFSLLIPILQWWDQLISEGPSNSLDSSIYQPEGLPLTLGITKRKGAVIIYANRKLQRKTIYLASNPNGSNASIYSTSHVIKRSYKGHTYFSSIFPSTKPGHYYIIIDSHIISEVTVGPNHLSEIDLR